MNCTNPFNSQAKQECPNGDNGLAAVPVGTEPYPNGLINQVMDLHRRVRFLEEQLTKLALSNDEQLGQVRQILFG